MGPWITYFPLNYSLPALKSRESGAYLWLSLNCAKWTWCGRTRPIGIFSCFCLSCAMKHGCWSENEKCEIECQPLSSEQVATFCISLVGCLWPCSMKSPSNQLLRKHFWPMAFYVWLKGSCNILILPEPGDCFISPLSRVFCGHAQTLVGLSIEFGTCRILWSKGPMLGEFAKFGSLLSAW